MVLNEWAYRRPSFVQRWRSDRMRSMLALLHLPKGARVLDLGGTEYMWHLMDHDFHDTLLNLPGTNLEVSDSERFASIEGDACDLSDLRSEAPFDLVFSNSVIEHVGDLERQKAFADSVKSMGRAYWVQTPSVSFPVECHTGSLFWWKLPESARSRMIERWRQRSPEWASVIEDTRGITLAQMKTLFPEADVYFERRLGLRKSYASYRLAS